MQMDGGETRRYDSFFRGHVRIAELIEMWLNGRLIEFSSKFISMMKVLDIRTTCCL